jgi:hypothetical protein
MPPNVVVLRRRVAPRSSTRFDKFYGGIARQPPEAGIITTLTRNAVRKIHSGAVIAVVDLTPALEGPGGVHGGSEAAWSRPRRLSVDHDPAKASKVNRLYAANHWR